MLYFFQRKRDAELQSETQPAASHCPLAQPSVAEAWDRQKKYDEDSQEAKKINRAVAIHICMDQVPIYTVEKPGFKQLLLQLNSKYSLPSRNYFMDTEIPALYNEIKNTVTDSLVGNRFYSCTTDLWTSRANSCFMAVTLQFITESWKMKSWCLGCAGMHSDHTGDSLKEALEEMVHETWKLDMSDMAGITTDNASNNKKAFEEAFTWVPCFGHNLHLAVGRGLNVGRVPEVLSRLRKTVSAFSRSPKMYRKLKIKQKGLNLEEHKLVHDEPTRWDSTYQMVDRFLEQQQAVCAVLAEDRKKWHLMPKDKDIEALQVVQEVFSPLSGYTDALSGEKHTTLSSVLPLCWKIFKNLTVEESDSNLKCQIKEAVGGDLKKGYENHSLQLLLNTATFLDPRFKDSFVTMKEEVKQSLTNSVDGPQTAQPPPEPEAPQPAKKKKTDLAGLLFSIQGEKKSLNVEDEEEASAGLTHEFMIYDRICEEKKGPT